MTRDPATHPHVGDVWQDRHGITMTVTALQVGHLTTTDMVTTEIRGHPFSFTIKHFADMVRTGNLIRVDGERRLR